ncbi:M20 family metallopeptidase [Streptomyces sp. NBC_00683]|uniref:M20 metallopeptidase family protein n=1 Tax=Streptomyces sp. NBC_00683 TaxID=2903670 RepID=UPI002E362935|nr:M20 family metallopeptidase [Streptomyces sp. NBC_00683]
MTGTLPAAGPLEDLVRLREDLHREPELGLHLPQTQAKVLAALDGLPLEITTGSGLSSVTAVLRGRGGEHGQGDPPVVLLRADMDALPLTEATGLPYASEFEGRAHACGHDLHTAMLVGAARLLAEERNELAGDVIFMFQPGEEGHHGARLMIEEGVLEAAGPGRRPVAAYALHVASSILPAGLALTRKGPLLAGGDALRVTVRGRGGHDSQPHLLRDPVPAACEMVLALQTYASRGFDPFDPVLISVGSIHAGTSANIIPDEAELKIGIRTFGPGAKAQVLSGVTRVLEGVAAAHGVTVTVDHSMDYPVTVVDPAEADFAAETVEKTLGPGRLVWAPTPLSASEDFSFVLDEVPGAMLFLGACPPDRDLGTASFNHSPDAVFGSEVLGDGARLLADLAGRRLASAG